MLAKTVVVAFVVVVVVVVVVVAVAVAVVVSCCCSCVDVADAVVVYPDTRVAPLLYLWLKILPS